MSKKNLVFLFAVCMLVSNAAFADVQSPIYTDDIGRSHFLGRGGYNEMRSMQMNEAQAGAVDAAVMNLSNQEKKQEAKDITDVIKEKPLVPAASHKSSFSSEKGKMDASRFYGYGGTNIPAGVNESKTIYTDELGRLHFFGKANQIKE